MVPSICMGGGEVKAKESDQVITVFGINYNSDRCAGGRISVYS